MTTERVTPGVWMALGSAAVLLLYLIVGPGFHGVTGFGTGMVAGLLGAYGLLAMYRQTPAAPATGGTDPLRREARAGAARGTGRPSRRSPRAWPAGRATSRPA